MLITEITIPVGAETPFRMLHMSDNHLCLADARDNERKNTLAKNRANAFTGGHPQRLLDCLEDLLAFARKENLPILHTGDMIDFVSEANLDYTKKVFNGVDVFAAAGNHEFSQYVGEAWEDEAYKARSFDHVKAAFPGDFWFQTRMVNGIKFIAVDNNYYYVTPEQLELFRRETADGIPAVLILHNPLYSEDLYAQVTAGKKPDAPPYLFGCPEPLLRTLNDHRYRQQKPDTVTEAFLQLCNSLPNLKAVLGGHLHKYYASRLDSGTPQYVAGSGYAREANLYTFI
ncbi:MAG: metallophosphoesterase [Clostridia bacterium]|nr:metallophosphoesterase [Clostridia bacterium]